MFSIIQDNKFLKFQRATELIGKCVDGLRGKRHVTFLTGNAGPIALGAVFYHLHADKEESKNMISKLVIEINYFVAMVSLLLLIWMLVLQIKISVIIRG